jgi:hypothetical protein
MVSVLASAVDHGLSQTKDYKIDICCFSTKHAALRRSWFGIGITYGCTVQKQYHELIEE